MPPQPTHLDKVAHATRSLGPPTGGPAVPVSPDGGLPMGFYAPTPSDLEARHRARMLLPAFAQLIADGAWTPQAVGQVLREMIPRLVSHLGLSAAIEVLKALPGEIDSLPALPRG